MDRHATELLAARGNETTHVITKWLNNNALHFLPRTVSVTSTAGERRRRIACKEAVTAVMVDSYIRIPLLR